MPQYYSKKNYDPEFIATGLLQLEETRDIIRNMIKKESETYFEPNTSSLSTNKNPWRRLMINWMCNVVDVFKLSNHIVSVAVYYLDTSVANNLVESPEDYKLVALTALNLAIKVYDFKLLPLQQLLYFSHTEITLQDVSEMERQIIASLKWMLHPPTFDCFIRQYSTLLNTCGIMKLPRKMVAAVEQKAQELSRIAIFTESFRRFRPSILAYAAMLLAMDHLLQGQEEMMKTKEFTTEMSHVSNFSYQSEGFLEAVNELGSYLDSNGSVTAEPVKNKRSYNVSTNQSPIDDTTSSYPSPVRKQHEIITISSPCKVSESM